MFWRHNLKVKFVISVPFNTFVFLSQETEENKGATSWPEYYIDQLNSMAAVSMSFLKTFSFLKTMVIGALSGYPKAVCPLNCFNQLENNWKKYASLEKK